MGGECIMSKKTHAGCPHLFHEHFVDERVEVQRGFVVCGQDCDAGFFVGVRCVLRGHAATCVRCDRFPVGVAGSDDLICDPVDGFYTS